MKRKCPCPIAKPRRQLNAGKNAVSPGIQVMLLVLLAFLAPAPGQSQLIQSLQFEDGLSSQHSLVQLDADTFVLAYQGVELDGFIKTFNISSDGTTITEVQSLEHDETLVDQCTMVLVDADTVALAYRRNSSNGFLKTFNIPADGSTITEAQSIQFETMDSVFSLSLVRVDSDTVVLAYDATTIGGTLKTFDISADGMTISEVQSLVHDPGSAQGASLTWVDGDTYALAFRSISVGSRGAVKTFTVPPDGSTITQVQLLQHLDNFALDNTLIRWDADTVLLAYRDVGSNGWLKTFDISTGGTTITEVEAFQYASAGNSALVQLDNDSAALVHRGSGSTASSLRTFDIPADGSSITPVQILPTGASSPSLVRVDANIYALARSGNGVDGFLETFGITPRGILVDLALTKTDGVTAATPGLTTLVYTIVATNHGASEDSSVSVTDTFPAGLSCTYTSVAAGGATGNTAVGSGDLAETLVMPAGSSVTYTASCTIALSAMGTLSNTATISGSMTDLTPDNNTATDDDTVLLPVADLAITKTDGVTAAIPGQTTLVYTIIASNNSGSADPSVSVTDTFPAALDCTYTSVASGGATGNTAVGSGDLSETLSLPAGSSVTYTASCTIDPAATGTLSNTAAISGSLIDPIPGNNSATDADTSLTPQADLAITKTDGLTSAIPGQTTLIYTIVASNAGPSDDAAVSVTDVFPSDLTCTYTSAAAGGATGNTVAGSGNLSETLSLPSGSSVTYTASCTIDPTATGTLSNTASISGSLTDPVPGNNSATDADTVLAPEADLAITKTDGVTSAVPGQSLSYTIVASNSGPSDDSTVSVADVFPADLTCTYTSAASGGATGNTAAGAGDLADTLSLPSGSSVTYNAYCSIDPAASGTLSNTATINGSTTDPNPRNDSATDADTALAPEADLAITKTDSVTSAVPGQSVTYTIVASNSGPSNDPAVSVTDLFPADLICTYTSVASGGATGNTAAGAGDLAETLSLPSGSSVTYTANCSIDPAASGTLSNTATIDGSATDPNPGNDSATDADTALAPEADLAITKTDSVTSAVPGQSVTYTIVASNSGPSNDPAVSVTDLFPADLTCTYTSVAAGGATGNTAAGSGDLADTLSLPNGSSVTYTAICVIDPDAQGTLSNTATITASVTDLVPGNDSATDNDTVLAPEADLAITKTDGVTSAAPGQSVTYTIVASNSGPSNDTAVNVTDVFPADLTCTYTSVAAGGATGNTAAGSGDLADSLSLPSGSSVTYTAICTIDPAASGTLSNTATINGSAADPNPDNNSATDADTALAPEADLAITKTDGMTSAEPGELLTYTIVASNLGPSTAPSVTVIDAFPAALSDISWTCTATTGSSCPASGTGDINAPGSLLAGGSLTFTAQGTVDPTFAGVLTNSTNIEAVAGVTDPDPSNNQAVDVTAVSSSAVLSATKTVTGEFYEGGTVYYLITLLNVGPMTQLDNPGDELIDELPSDLSLVGAVATAGVANVDFAQNRVTWNGSIAADGVVEIEIEAVIQQGAAGQTISNQGTVFFDADGNGSNESSAGTDDPEIGGGDDATIFQVLTTVEIPTLGDLSLSLLALLLVASAMRRLRPAQR